MATDSASLQPLLDELRAKHGVVGATLGVLRGDAIDVAASGLLNLDTGVECTPGSVFQIGSIGKIFTTTLIMQLVDEGRLRLDDPARKHLRNFTLADPAAARAITVRQLLNHTSGMDGDLFPADDPEGASTASYLRKMWLLPNLYPPGDGPMTYCNSGFVTAGRIVEVLTGLTWQTAVMERICKPLRLTNVFSYPHEALRFRCAMGHVADPKDMKKIGLAPATFLALSAAAAGSVLSMSVESVLQFAKLHMADGVYGNGARLLSAESARRMREDTIPIPLFSRAGVSHWGLGWFVCNGHGYRMAGHDGGTLGQFTYLRTFPDKGVGFALFTNSPSAGLYDEIETYLMGELTGTSIPPEPPRQEFALDLDRYVGCYANIASRYTVEAKGAELSLHLVSRIGALPEVHAALEPYREDVFTMRAEGTPVDGQKVCFLGGEGKRTFIRAGPEWGAVCD